jgi:ketosteroid isomerase-like protein
MATELEPVVRRLFEDFDSLNFGAISKYTTNDAQGVDEISRRWIRGADKVASYFAQLGPVLADVRSHITDLNEVIAGDTGLVTFWLEQSYVVGGQPQQVSAPTTIVLRRVDGEWKIALIHSVPLPAEP